MSPEVKLFQREIPASSGRPWVIGSSFNSSGVGRASAGGGGAAESGAQPWGSVAGGRWGRR